MASEVEKDDSVTAAKATTTAVGVSPGEILRKARESKGLSIIQLAGQTRLGKATIEALEKNEFDSTKPVFIRGYFRKCAPVLQVSEEDLINAYAAWSGTPVAPEALAPVFVEPPREYEERRVSGLTYWVGIGIFLGIVVWWLASNMRHSSPTPVAGTEPAQQSSAISSNGQSRTLTLSPQSAAAITPAPTEVPSVKKPAIQPEPASKSEAQTQIGSEASAAADHEAAVEPSDDTAGSVISSGQVQVRAEHSASWVEIYDSDGKRLVYDLLQPGEHREVSGKPPYQVTLGKPDGLYLALGGKQVDLKPYTSPGGTAHFKLDEP